MVYQSFKNREFTTKELEKLGFTLTNSMTNFVFAKHKDYGGEFIYQKLRDNAILVRHFSLERIKDFNRITIGTREQMDILIEKIICILEEEK